jgi:hypothetical protein
MDAVANLYLAGLREARGQVEPAAARLTSGLDAAVAAVGAGAWVSTAGDAFAQELLEQVRALGRAGAAVRGEIEDEAAGQPPRVEPHTWQARWGGAGFRWDAGAAR